MHIRGDTTLVASGDGYDTSTGARGRDSLVDENKRLGWLSLVVFYGLNGIELDVPDDEAYDLVIAVAGGTAAYPEVAARWSHPSSHRSIGASALVQSGGGVPLRASVR